MYSAEDVGEWIKGVRFVEGGVRGVDEGMVRSVVQVLREAGVVDGHGEMESVVEELCVIPRRE